MSNSRADAVDRLLIVSPLVLELGWETKKKAPIGVVPLHQSIHHSRNQLAMPSFFPTIQYLSWLMNKTGIKAEQGTIFRMPSLHSN